MRIKLNEQGEVVVRGEWTFGADHVHLPDCSSCGKPQNWYLSDLPRDWSCEDVVVIVRLAKDGE